MPKFVNTPDFGASTQRLDWDKYQVGGQNSNIQPSNYLAGIGTALSSLIAENKKKNKEEEYDPTKLYTNQGGASKSDLMSTNNAPGFGQGVTHMPGPVDVPTTQAPALDINLPIKKSEESTLSDENEKTNVKEIDDAKIDKMIENIHGYRYNYKHPHMSGASEGVHFGPLAQDLEKSEIGKSMVKEGPDGRKRVDYGQGFGALLGIVAHLNDKINKLEKK